jgi:large conductance mechanosensitive channel
MSMLQEFKTFALRGNVVDMAVGIIIGAAFSGIVSSLVADVIMPPLGIIIGSIDFSNMSFILKDSVGSQAEVALRYGKFIQKIIDFTLISFCIFMMIKVLNSIRKKEETKDPEPSHEEILLTEIRDILKVNSSK